MQGRLILHLACTCPVLQPSVALALRRWKVINEKNCSCSFGSGLPSSECHYMVLTVAIDCEVRWAEKLCWVDEGLMYIWGSLGRSRDTFKWVGPQLTLVDSDGQSWTLLDIAWHPWASNNPHRYPQASITTRRPLWTSLCIFDTYRYVYGHPPILTFSSGVEQEVVLACVCVWGDGGGGHVVAPFV